MIVPLEKLLTHECNKYVFTKAMMHVVDKIDNIKDYPQEDIRWKVVPNIIKLVLEGNIKYNYNKKEEE